MQRAFSLSFRHIWLRCWNTVLFQTGAVFSKPWTPLLSLYSIVIDQHRWNNVLEASRLQSDRDSHGEIMLKMQTVILPAILYLMTLFLASLKPAMKIKLCSIKSGYLLPPTTRRALWRSVSPWAFRFLFKISILVYALIRLSDPCKLFPNAPYAPVLERQCAQLRSKTHFHHYSVHLCGRFDIISNTRKRINGELLRFLAFPLWFPQSIIIFFIEKVQPHNYELRTFICILILTWPSAVFKKTSF